MWGCSQNGTDDRFCEDRGAVVTCLPSKMKLKLLQRCCIWFSFSKGKNFDETMADMRQVFGRECISQRSIQQWWHDFQTGVRTRDTLSDKKRSGHPRTARNPENKNVIFDLVQADHRITIPQLMYQSGMSYGSVQRTLKKDLGMTRIAAKFVPRMLSEIEMNLREMISRDWLDKVENDPQIMDRIITGDESWVWCFEPESKKQSTQWIQRGVDQRPKKFRRSRSIKKVMIAAFFDHEGIVHVDFLDGKKVDSEAYIDILMRLRDSIHARRPQKWLQHDWILLDDNASVHTSDETTEFRRQVRMSRGSHPPYSPDLAPCDFFLFPLLKSKLHGQRFPDLDSLKVAIQDVFDSIPQSEFARCFANLQHRWLRCVDVAGQYFEGDDW